MGTVAGEFSAGAAAVAVSKAQVLANSLAAPISGNSVMDPAASAAVVAVSRTPAPADQPAALLSW